MTTRSKLAVDNKAQHLGVATCQICNHEKKDCVEIKKNWMSTLVICDSCCREVFLRFDRNVGGDAADKIEP